MTDAPTIVSELFARLEKAWNAGDGQAFAAPMTDDVDFVDIRGTRHHSRTVVAHGHDAIFATLYNGSTMSYTVDDAREIAPGWIVAHVSARLESPTGPLAPLARSMMTAVVTDAAGEWQIATLQNTLVTA